MKLDGAVALVTGAGQGIGRAIAGALADAGASVALLGRGEAELERAAGEIRSQGGEALVLTADVTNAEAVAAAMKRIDCELGPLDVLVANAGRLRAVGRAWEIPVAEWWRDVEVNLLGTHVCCREALRRMSAARRGTIVLLTSGAGTRGPHVHASAYGASKLALAGYAETLAREAEGLGVRIFAVDPGSVQTSMTEPLLLDPEWRRWLPGFSEAVAAGRDLPVTAAAALVLALASGAADALTGRVISAREDLDELVAAAEEIRERELLVPRVTRKP